MARSSKVDSGAALATLIQEVFLLNGRLLSVGDKLAAEQGLTSARWQVLGVIAFSPTPQPVARLAHRLGLRRQGVQRIVNDLAEEGVVNFLENPHHRRAKLVDLTPKGRALHDAARRLQAPWMASLSDGVDAAALTAASDIIATLRKRLDDQEKAGTKPGLSRKP